jgi:ATPase family associated with various cellular activities (AAA)/AAA+ lid domain
VPQTDRQQDLELVLRSRRPLVVIETRDESRVLDMLKEITLRGSSGDYVPLFRWTVTDGLQRLDISLEPQLHNAEPTEALKHIRAVTKPGIYVLLDFHHYLDDPVNIRLLKDICISFMKHSRQLVLISHEISLPGELEGYSARFELALPDETEREAIVKRVAREYVDQHPGRSVKTDAKAYALLIQNLAGLTEGDTEQLARNAIFVDGAITHSDLPDVMQAKYELLNRGGVLQFEYDTRQFSDVGGLNRLQEWLVRRKPAFDKTATAAHLDTPKGMLLIGIQGCGKSLAARATAGVLGIPLLRLDFASLYNKYHGETERNLRESLRTADVMAPCVLWIDEIEKGIAGRGGETGTTQRVLGSFLAWLADKNSQVFVVATANDISALPPELIRKGRFDEIFFVDLPDDATRHAILGIHLRNRKQSPADIDLAMVAARTDGFSGAELEQVVVSALYAAHAQAVPLSTDLLLAEVDATRPLSVVMAEKVAALREWAEGRTVPCH